MPRFRMAPTCRRMCVRALSAKFMLSLPCLPTGLFHNLSHFLIKLVLSRHLGPQDILGGCVGRSSCVLWLVGVQRTLPPIVRAEFVCNFLVWRFWVALLH